MSLRRLGKEFSRPMHKRLSYLLILFCFFSCQEENSTSNFHYTLEPIVENEQYALKVSLPLKTDGSGIMRLHFKNDQWGEKNLYKTLNHFSSCPEAKDLRIMPDSNMILIQHEPFTSFEFSYRVIQDQWEEEILNGHTYRPIVQESYFHSFGNRLFVYPCGSFKYDSAKLKFLFDWKVDEDYLIHNSFGTEKHQELYLTRAQLSSSVFVGGDFRRYSSYENGNKIHFVTRGDWIPFDEKEVNKILNIAIRSHKAFWQDYSDSLYSVTMIPTHEKDGYSLGGTGLTSSFATFISNNKHVELWRIKYLFFHELLHNWIGHKIQNRDEELQYWFSEGFTDYYTYKLMFRNGLLSLEEYIKLFNEEVLRLHFGSPIRGVPNEYITYDRFWSDPEYEKLPYRRGMIYALYLDNRIKLLHKEKSLDHMMRDILDACYRIHEAKFDHGLFRHLLKKYASKEDLDEFFAYIEQGRLINLSRNLAPGLKVYSEKGIPYFKILDSEILEAFLRR